MDDELRSAFEGFTRGRAWGGEPWKLCVSQLLDLERMHGFVDTGKLKAPARKEERPAEVADFMQLRRRWGVPFPLKSEVGPREVEKTFSAQWWTWWRAGQPAARLGLEGEDKWAVPSTLPADEWDDMRKRHGRNGMLLYRASMLLADWRLVVEDVCAVLSEVVKGMGVGVRKSHNNDANKLAAAPAEKTPPSGTRRSSKRKNEAEKENATPALLTSLPVAPT
ncbi:hypothetical protein B0H14DRAFT_3523828 [Mycena olivaceomarginata]|nr:hypothetical protein B0H14DRAFT_3523828 [Mycena olivaceomarginata]